MRTLYKIPDKRAKNENPKSPENKEEETPNNVNIKDIDDQPSCSSGPKRKSNVDIASPAKRAKKELDSNKKENVRYVPFNQLLSGVTLVISGIQVRHGQTKT